MPQEVSLQNQARAALSQLATQYLVLNGGDVGALERIVSNTQLNLRQQLMTQTFGIAGQQRNIDLECGYPTGPIDSASYKTLFENDGIAYRANNVWPEETFRQTPEINETEKPTDSPFEKEVKRVFKKFNIWHYLERVDTLSGVGRYGALLLGLDDGRNLDQPVVSDGVLEPKDTPTENLALPPISKATSRKLTYLRTFDETLCQISAVVTDQKSSRLGQPLKYQVTLSDPSLLTSTTSSPSSSVEVHWQRIIHICDNRTTSEIVGSPRCQRTIKQILDLIKTLGAAGQGYWSGAFPGISFETDPEIAAGGVDIEDAKKQIEDYMAKLQRYLALDGLHANSLTQQIADPTAFVGIHLDILCMIIGIPKRVFMGSEVGQLASTQDRQNWDGRVSKRRTQYVTPFIIRPLVERLVLLGVLPMPTKGYDAFEVMWPDIYTPSDDDKAATCLKWVQAMQAYVAVGCDVLIPPEVFMTMYLDLTTEEVKVVMEALEEHLVEKEEVDEEQLNLEAEANAQAMKAAGVQPAPNGQPKPGAIPPFNKPPVKAAKA